MTWTRFQRLALIAFITVEVLIFVGAVVRATGSGLGCPDWPFCYGCVVPPTSAEDIDFTKIDLEKFRAKAARHGRDPATITPETLKAEFDPVATWVEYINRLTSLPVGFSMLALLIASFGQIRLQRKRVFLASVTAFALVLINAWLGARVVFSGLKPGIITLHMALAILLQCVLVYTAWRANDRPWTLPWKNSLPSSRLRWLAWGLFALIVIEGVMGSQVRELTDHLAHTHAGEPRSQWVIELENSWVYLVHRSFSWLILVAGIAFLQLSRKHLTRAGWLEWSIISLIFSQMILGIVLAHVGIVGIAQVLHIGLSSLLVSALFLWLLGSSRKPATVSGITLPAR
ncbi:cytochrome c oxidase assembly protein subunit 15 [Prosthecobacter fusiformis]|uniref:Cytochrome c oxidase assembly protein subunit 15 n=1 Tax=Prosthecobacter fusiformis TaxID=48464 RepID=A0A4R7SS22_9BACT|nr:COX15/CtaA family protein [Prosthecobacter fusiformis]TDU80987.1 cytochrome c oxidase assembly protein subunit 15 [Prosthecobacter fusiformis]